MQLRRQLAQIITVALLLTIVVLQLALIYQTSGWPKGSYVHTVVLNWPPQQIPANTVISGYVGNWSWSVDAKIVAVQVWMGNPSGTRWEGDVYVTLNDKGIFNNSTDQVVVHYQLDAHAESSAPHQLMFQIGSGGSGFLVKAGQTIWVYRAFNNVSDHPTTAGDGQVIIYYQAD